MRGEGGCVGVQNSGCVTGGEGGHPVERVLAATAATRCQPGSNNHHGGSGGMTWREHTLVGVYSGSSRAASPTSLNRTAGACSNSWWFRAVAGLIFPPPSHTHTHAPTAPPPHPPHPPSPLPARPTPPPAAATPPPHCPSWQHCCWHHPRPGHAPGPGWRHPQPPSPGDAGDAPRSGPWAQLQVLLGPALPVWRV